MEFSKLNGYDVKDKTSRNAIERNILDVKYLGAKGDGITDDTQTLQSAINYCKENNIGRLVIPDGIYIITSTLTIDFSNFEIYGVGNATLKYNGMGNNDRIIKIIGTSTDNYIENIKVHDLIIDGTNQLYKGGESLDNPGVTSTQPLYKGIRAIEGRYLKNVKIYNCLINDIYGDGIVFYRSTNIKIDNNTLNDCSGGNPRRRSGGSSYDDFGDGITVFEGWNCQITNNTVINTRKYLTSSKQSDIGTICGRSGLEFEYKLTEDDLNTPGYDLFSTDDAHGLIMNNNYVYGYTKGAHFENNTEASVINNTFKHNCIGCLSSTKGYINFTNNHFDDDGCNIPIQSGYDAYAGGIAISNYTGESIYGENIISNNIFRGSQSGINLGKGRIIISNNTFYNTDRAINTVNSIKDIKINNNTFYNNRIGTYNPENWILENNMFHNTTNKCISGMLKNFKFKGNTFTNSIEIIGTAENIEFTSNIFKTLSEVQDLVVNNAFINIYGCVNFIFKNNNCLLTENDTCIVIRSTNNVDSINIENNVFKVNGTRTSFVNSIGGTTRNLSIENNTMYGNSDDLPMVKHAWELDSANFINNKLENQNGYVYYQSSGGLYGKYKQEMNKGKLHFHQTTPNSSLNTFKNYYFNNGEILHNFNGNASDFKCTSSGFYVSDTWVSGTEYANNKLIKNSSNKVYKCITKGSGSSTVEPTHTTSTDVTESDGYTWKYLNSLATIIEINN